MSVTSVIPARNWPQPRALLELIKPITWFPPMWAYLCGVVSAGVWPGDSWGLVVLGVVLAGPVVCGMSQAANDWCDRHVDAVNEPGRPIPSGRVPGRWGLWVALAMSVLSLAIGWQLGPWGFGATVVGVIAAWAYSAEPVRLKRSGWRSPGPTARRRSG
jgi:chlorophyll synthase